MLSKFFTLACATILTVNAFAVSLVTRAESQTKTDSIESEILKVTRKYSVYLPADYDTRKGKEYPVLYLLHGLHGTSDSWPDAGNLRNIADKLINTGQACEMIIVLPDAGTVKDGYFNTEGWPYETFFFDEFIPYIEKKYRIIGDKQHRAIAGLSMGGGGATVYALKHPDMFSSVYAMSALMSLPEQERVPVIDPVREEFGRSVLANSCIDMVAFNDQATLEKYRTILWFVDCGDDDFLLDVNYRFFREMTKAKVPCQFRVRDGGHTWEYWKSALHMALPFVSEAFGK